MAPHRFMPVVLAAIVGCASTRSLPSYHTLATDRHAARSLKQARQHNEEGLAFVLRGDPSRAEAAFRDALRSDLRRGPRPFRAGSSGKRPLLRSGDRVDAGQTTRPRRDRAVCQPHADVHADRLDERGAA